VDCVYHAYADYMEWLGEPVTPCDYRYYKILKWWTHGSKPQYTFGGVAPWIIGKLTGLHGLTCATFYRVYTPAHFTLVAQKYYKSHFGRMYEIIKRTKWVEVNSISGFPGIYFLLTGQHAMFSDCVPKYGTPIMLIQLWKEIK
jgi:hypothetical protein